MENRTTSRSSDSTTTTISLGSAERKRREAMLAALESHPQTRRMRRTASLRSAAILQLTASTVVTSHAEL